MGPALIVVDTDVLIDVSRNVAEAIDVLQRTREHDELAISTVTQMEFIVGCRNHQELRSLRSFLRPFRILRISESISEKALELLLQYRLSHGLLLADSLIAASVLSYQIPFLSKNQKHYRFIEGLKLLSYPSARF